MIFQEGLFSELVGAGTLEIGDGYRAKNNELGGSGPIFLRSAYLQNRGFRLSNPERFRTTALSRFGSKVARTGDVVITTKGNSTGRVGRIRETEAGSVYSPHLSYWRSKRPDEIDPLFLYYWSQSREFQMQLAGMAASTDMAPYLSLRDQLRLRISYPSNKSQRAIASILIALDDKIDLNRRMDETLEEMAWAIFDETRQISNWPEIPLRALVEIFDGPHATPKLTDNGPIFLGIFNLANGRIDLGIANRLSEDDFNRWTQRVQPRAGDLVFSYETRLGQAALIPSGLRCCLGRRMGLLRIKLGEISPAVLLRVYLATQFQEVLRQRTIHGSTADRIPLSELGSFPIRVPRGAQEKALSFLLSPLQERCDTNEREAESLAAMRDLLLPKLMSGEIRVRDAEHQQESVL